MDFDDFSEEDPHFWEKVVSMERDLGFGQKEANAIGITGRDYYIARLKDVRSGKLLPIFAETADEWITKEREQLITWKVSYDAQVVADLEASSDADKLIWSPF